MLEGNDAKLLERRARERGELRSEIAMRLPVRKGNAAAEEEAVVPKVVEPVE